MVCVASERRDSCQRSAQQLDAAVGDDYAIADAQTRSGGLADRRPGTVVVFDAYFGNIVGLVFLDLMAHIAATDGTDDGRHGPAGTPANQAAQPPADQRTADGSEPVGRTPADFSAYIKSEIAKWAKVVKETGIKAE